MPVDDIEMARGQEEIFQRRYSDVGEEIFPWHRAASPTNQSGK